MRVGRELVLRGWPVVRVAVLENTREHSVALLEAATIPAWTLRFVIPHAFRRYVAQTSLSPPWGAMLTGEAFPRLNAAAHPRHANAARPTTSLSHTSSRSVVFGWNQLPRRITKQGDVAA